MLVVYRTNESFAGRIVSLERQQSLVEFEAWRAAAQPTPEMAAIVVDESLLHADLLADLAVNTATYRVVGGVTATLSASAYALRTGTEPGYVLFDGSLLPTVTLADMAGVKVRYDCGYGAAINVPKPIFQAMLLLIGHWYANREAVAAGNLGPLPMAVDALLAPYRVHWFGEWSQ